MLVLLLLTFPLACLGVDVDTSSGPLKPISAMLSTLWDGFPAERCIDGQVSGTSSMCHTNHGEKTPWLALDFGARVTVERVIINNRDDCCGLRLKNAEVRVADQLPSSGQVMSTGGQLLGTFKGPGKNGEVVSLTSSTPLQGSFVIVQTNHSPGTGYLNLNEVTVWGKSEAWTSLSTGDYLFSTKAGSWEEGRALCAREGGRLVEIRSKDESDAIGEFIATVPALKNSNFWIGLSDQHQENDWRWQGSNLMAVEGFTNWYVGEPNNWNENEHCALTYSGSKWIDAPCSWSHPPICEKGCSNTMSLSGNGLNGMPSGLYKKQALVHNNKPVYKYNGDVASAGEWCIFQGKLGEHGGHWKVDHCGFLWGTNQGDWSQGIASSKVAADCPEDIGNQWRYYSWKGDSDSGPVDPDLRLTPGDSMSESGFTGGVCDEGNTDFDWCPRVKETAPGELVKRQVSCWTLPCWKLNHCPRYKNAKRPKAVIRAFPCCCAHKKIHDTEQFKPICKLGNV